MEEALWHIVGPFIVCCVFEPGFFLRFHIFASRPKVLLAKLLEVINAGQVSCEVLNGLVSTEVVEGELRDVGSDLGSVAPVHEKSVPNFSTVKFFKT